MDFTIWNDVLTRMGNTDRRRRNGTRDFQASFLRRLQLHGRRMPASVFRKARAGFDSRLQRCLGAKGRLFRGS
jgi:hypothetical protein